MSTTGLSNRNGPLNRKSSGSMFTVQNDNSVSNEMGDAATSQILPEESQLMNSDVENGQGPFPESQGAPMNTASDCEADAHKTPITSPTKSRSEDPATAVTPLVCKMKPDVFVSPSELKNIQSERRRRIKAKLAQPRDVVNNDSDNSSEDESEIIDVKGKSPLTNAPWKNISHRNREVLKAIEAQSKDRRRREGEH